MSIGSRDLAGQARPGPVTDGRADDGSLVIEVRDVRKVYGPAVALEHAWLEVRTGEIHALLGENGAGKSTLVRILAGVEEADGGTVRLFGRPAVGGAADRQAYGCAFIHQELGLFPELTVAENIALVGGFVRRVGLIRHRETVARALEIIDRLDMSLDPNARVGDLLVADQTQVAVARALSRGARLIVLDEPTAYLEVAQVRRLFSLLGRLRDDGIACLVITHRAEDVLASCDRFTVFRDGSTVASQPTAGATERDLVRLITGHAATGGPEAPAPHGVTEPVLQANQLAGPGFADLTFTVGAGEAVGLCGLADAGHFAAGEAIFGLSGHTGTILIDGEEVAIGNPAQAMRARIGFVPRDRRAMGLALQMSARENLFLQPTKRWHQPIRIGAERRQAGQLMERFHVRPPDPDREVATLSGGNQQKVLLAKWFNRNPRVMVLNEPTAGVDLGARAEIYDNVRRACRQASIGLVIISSDFVEIAEFCDRAIVMRRGRAVAQIAGERLSSHALTELAYGGSL
jgi:ribose transport system ATP-binding protein